MMEKRLLEILKLHKGRDKAMLAVEEMIETELHPADTLFCWLVTKVTDCRSLEKVSFIEIKDKLHELYNSAYEDGYRRGQEDEHEESRRPLGK